LSLILDPEFLCLVIQDLLGYAAGLLASTSQQGPQLLGGQMQHPASAHCTSATFTQAADMPTTLSGVHNHTGHWDMHQMLFSVAPWLTSAKFECLIVMENRCKLCTWCIRRWDGMLQQVTEPQGDVHVIQLIAKATFGQQEVHTLTNRLVFFSRKPVKFICSCFGSRPCRSLPCTCNLSYNQSQTEAV